jgi:5-methylcytosine-specific restriction endonuclease McrA
MGKYYCKDCKKELNENSEYYKTERCHSCNAKYRYQKNEHPFIKLIGKHSWNYKGIENFCKCTDCGNKISKVTYYRGKRCRSCESKRRIKLGITGYSDKNIGENNTNWQGGISKLPYSFEFTLELKEQIRNRDNHTCQNCGMTEEEHLIVVGKVLTIHHIDYNKENCDKDNLITLCGSCNTRANFNRDYWFEFYKQKVCTI